MKKVQFVSKAQAFAQQEQGRPGRLRDPHRTTLPDSFRVTPDKPDNVNAVRLALMKGATPIDASIATVSNRQADAQKILTATSLVKVTMAVLAALS